MVCDPPGAMSMGRKKTKQVPMFVPHTVTQAPGHRFYEKLNELLSECGFDGFVEDLCEPYYDGDRSKGRQSIPPGVYFRMILIGFFEGIESERGICWRCADSLSLRGFLCLNLDDPIPDHSTLSRTRTRFPASVYDEVFKYVLSIVDAKVRIPVNLIRHSGPKPITHSGQGDHPPERSDVWSPVSSSPPPPAPRPSSRSWSF